MWCPVWVRVALVLSVLHNCYVESTLPLIQAATTLVIPENTPQGTVIGTLNATDADNDIISVTMDANTQYYVSLVHTDIPGRYTANITLRRKIDYESLTNDPVLLSFSATDQNTRIPVIHQIQLFITDVNDNPPRFNNQPYSTQIPENKAPGSVVFIANTTDTETSAGGQVYVSFAENNDIFNVSTSGTVRLAGKVDYETLPFYHLRLKATDGGGLSSEADLFVTITDVQDSPPYFTGLPYLPKIAENHTVGSSFYSVSAQDGDRGNPDDITFSLKSSTCPGYLEIKSDGSISLKKTADRDSGVIANNSGICMLTVEASEDIVSSRPQVGNRTTATETVTVTIEDIDDNPPTFSAHIYNASILENSPPGVPITFISTQMTVEDKDQGDFAKFTLTLDAYDDYFELVPSTVQGSATILVKVKNSSILDYEQRHSMTLTIRARESETHVSSVAIHLLIKNENDNSPMFVQSVYNSSVLERSPTGTLVTTIWAVDLDGPPYDVITYSLLDFGGKFDISSSGEVTVASAYTDREKGPIYYLTVVAEDSGGRKTTTELTVNVLDANDNVPQFSRDYEGYLQENKTTFRRPIIIHATDADIGRNGLVRYSIIRTYPSGWESHFDVDKTTGYLSVTSPLIDNSLPFSGEVALVVRAQDSGIPPLHSDVNVTVTVQRDSGTVCETNPCHNKHCLNGGWCRAIGDNGVCDCPSYYTGDLCQNNPCSGFPCFNGGVCTLDLGGVAKCACLTGFNGTHCETFMNVCQKDSCLNNGICTSTLTGVVCSCPLEYTGTRCEHAQNVVETCSDHFCHHHGSCIKIGDAFMCKCKPGFSGHRCQNVYHTCNSKPCNNGGTCRDSNIGYVCHCATGYSGPNCDVGVQSHTGSSAPISDVCTDVPNADCHYLHSTIDLCDETTIACRYCPRYCGICDRCKNKDIDIGSIIG